MSLRKCGYKDIDKWRMTIRKQHNRYRQRTGAFLYERKLWCDFEDELVLKSDMTDRQLSEYIERSVTAIQKRRWKLKKQKEREDEIQPNG